MNGTAELQNKIMFFICLTQPTVFYYTFNSANPPYPPTNRYHYHIIRLPTSVARPAGAGYFNNIFLKI